METKHPINAEWLLAAVPLCEAAALARRRWIEMMPLHRMRMASLADFANPSPVAVLPEPIVGEHRKMMFAVPGGSRHVIECYALRRTYFTGHPAQLPDVFILATAECSDPCLGKVGDQVVLFLPVEVEVGEQLARRDNGESCPKPVRVGEA